MYKSRAEALLIGTIDMKRGEGGGLSVGVITVIGRLYEQVDILISVNMVTLVKTMETGGGVCSSLRWR